MRTRRSGIVWDNNIRFFFFENAFNKIHRRTRRKGDVDILGVVVKRGRGREERKNHQMYIYIYINA